MAKACAIEYATQGYDLYLMVRNKHESDDFAQDLRVRTSRQIEVVELDVLSTETHQNIFEKLPVKPLGVISFVGYLGEQKAAEDNRNETLKIINTNFTGLVTFLNIVANEFEQRKSGFIVGVSSVAGDRGRASNYIYGAAKAALSAYLSGLRNRLAFSGVHVMTVKPGFVATKMTANMDLPEKLTAQPVEVAKDIFKAQQKNKNILYTKWYWRWIMLVIKSIPERFFKNMKL